MYKFTNICSDIELSQTPDEMDLRLADFYTCIINICEPLFKKNIGTCSTVMSQNVFILINVISHGMIMSVKNINYSFIII